MKIKLTETTAAEVEAEIALPLYIKHDLMADEYDSVIFMRVDQVGDKLRHVSVQTTDNKRVEIEVENNYRFDSRSGLDYCLGRGQYACTEAEFLKAVDRAQTLINLARG